MRLSDSKALSLPLFFSVFVCVFDGKSLARDKSLSVLGMQAGGRKARELALSRDVGRKMASRNNDAYIYEIYAWHPLQFDDFSSRVCVCVRDAYQQAAKLGKPPARFFFFSLIFNLNKRKVFFPSDSQGVFIAALAKGAWPGEEG